METPEERFAKGAMVAVWHTGGLLAARRPRTGPALELLRPYMACDRFEGVSQEKSDTTVHWVAAVVGDCYRLDGKVDDAIRWYRRASEFRRDGACAMFYADLVIQHRLQDHYERALECVRALRLAWGRNSLWLRILGWVLFGWHLLKHPWDFRRSLGILRRWKTFEATLVALLADGAAGASHPA